MTLRLIVGHQAREQSPCASKELASLRLRLLSRGLHSWASANRETRCCGARLARAISDWRNSTGIHNSPSIVPEARAGGDRSARSFSR